MRGKNRHRKCCSCDLYGLCVAGLFPQKSFDDSKFSHTYRRFLLSVLSHPSTTSLYLHNPCERPKFPLVRKTLCFQKCNQYYPESAKCALALRVVSFGIGTDLCENLWYSSSFLQCGSSDRCCLIGDNFCLDRWLRLRSVVKLCISLPTIHSRVHSFIQLFNLSGVVSKLRYT